MKKKELIKLINEYIGENLLHNGYEPYQEGGESGWIRRQANNNLNFVDLNYIPAGGLKSGLFIIEPSISISFKEIEDIMMHVLEKGNHRLVRRFRTLSFRLAELEAFRDGIIKGISHPRYNWLVDTEESIASVAETLKQKLDNLALPWIDANASIINVDKLLNENLKSYIIYSPSVPDRAMRGIIAGSLVKRTNLKQVVNFYDAAIRKCSTEIQAEYIDLKRYMLSNINN